jgi:hypothetical protein
MTGLAGPDFGRSLRFRDGCPQGSTMEGPLGGFRAGLGSVRNLGKRRGVETSVVEYLG